MKSNIQEWWDAKSGSQRLEIADKHLKSYLLPFSSKTIARLYNLEHSKI